MALSRTSPSVGPQSPDVTGFYDKPTGSIQYLVSDPQTRKAAIIDAVMGFDPASATTDSSGVEHILRYAETERLEIEWILDTHPHADHLLASHWLKQRLGKPNAIGAKVKEIAELWRGLYNMPDAFDPEADFNHLFEDGDTFQIGTLPVRVMLSPGHTLGSITYVVGDDAAFVHDTFMQPDAGTSRADFPAVQLTCCTTRCRISLPCPTPRASLSGMITAPPTGASQPGNPPCRNSAATTSTSVAACPETLTSRNAPRVTRP